MSENNISVERDFVGTLHIKVGDFDYVQIQYQHRFTDNASTRALADRIVAFLAQPAEAEGVDRQRMIESMCLTWRHDFGLDKPADCQLSSGMTGTERHQLRGQIGKLFDHHFAPALSAVTAERDRLLSEAHGQMVEAFAERDEVIAERDQLRAEVEASRLLLEQCNEVIAEDGGVYIELRAFLAGTMPASDVIALLRDSAMAVKEA